MSLDELPASTRALVEEVKRLGLAHRQAQRELVRELQALAIARARGGA